MWKSAPVIYIQQPEYWAIEVVGSLRGIGLPALAPYAVSIPLAGIIGTKGIEVVGATRSQRFDISTGGFSQAVTAPEALRQHGAGQEGSR